jgi:hypothetical protein
MAFGNESTFPNGRLLDPVAITRLNYLLLLG